VKSTSAEGAGGYGAWIGREGAGRLGRVVEALFLVGLFVLLVEVLGFSSKVRVIRSEVGWDPDDPFPFPRAVVTDAVLVFVERECSFSCC